MENKRKTLDIKSEALHIIQSLCQIAASGYQTELNSTAKRMKRVGIYFIKKVIFTVMQKYCFTCL